MPSSSAGHEPGPVGPNDERMGTMTLDDLDQVLAIEQVSFPTPWTRDNFRFEILGNRVAYNPVLRLGDRLVAYASVWFVADELKINNIAVAPDRRGRGLARRVLEHVLAEAERRGCREATLEVRPSNRPARSLYSRLGFRETGRRRGYYRDTGEDAILMALDLPGPNPPVERSAS